ncbi:MAG: hypothetical protein RSE94_03360 [Pseudomonas sp.]
MKELERFKDILDAEVEAARILDETQTERNQLLQHAQAKVSEAQTQVFRSSSTSDAPGLEKKLHRHFLREQVNKVNPRKEFFRIGLPAIREELEQLGVETQWTMSAKALEFKETQRIEQQITENPAIAAEWTRHQLEVEEAIEQSEEEALVSA